MAKSAIYTANTSAEAITLTAAQPTSAIPLGTIIRRYGCNINLSGNGILLDGDGYYFADVSVTATATSAGNYTVALYQDGVAVPGATQTVTAAAAGTFTINIPALLRLKCCGSSATLTLALSTTATLPATVTVNNVGVVAIKT